MALDLDREEDQKRNRAVARELTEGARAGADHGPISAEQRDHFHGVVQSMRRVLSVTPEIDPHPSLGLEERKALDCLYLAKTGIDPEQGEFISAVERSGFLNQALAALQPVLALGLEPELAEGKQAYEEIRAKVAALRKELTGRIALEAVPRAKKPAKEAKKPAGEPEPKKRAGPTEGDAAGDAGAEAPGEAAADEARAEAAELDEAGAADERERPGRRR